MVSKYTLRGRWTQQYRLNIDPLPSFAAFAQRVTAVTLRHVGRMHVLETFLHSLLSLSPATRLCEVWCITRRQCSASEVMLSRVTLLPLTRSCVSIMLDIFHRGKLCWSTQMCYYFVLAFSFNRISFAPVRQDRSSWSMTRRYRWSCTCA